MKKLSITIICLFLITFAQSQNVSIDVNQNSIDSYQEMNLQTKSQIGSFSVAKRARQISFNQELNNLNSNHVGEAITLSLFNDISYNSIVEKVTVDINGTKSIIAKLTDYQYSYCFISISGDNISMNIDIPERNEKFITKINPQNNYNHLLQLDEYNLDVLEGTHAEIPEDLSSEPNGFNLETPDGNSLFEQPQVQQQQNEIMNAGVNDPATIDVMIVYTPAALTWSNTNEGSMNNTIADAMAKANLASQNSNLGITYNLVYSGQVDYVEVDPNTDLDALRDVDGTIDDIHTIRDNNAADMVILFESTQATGGLGFVLQNRYGRDDLAFCLNRVEQVSWTYTMIHEMGHNMGASHHADQNYQEGPTTWNDWAENTWSAGWRWTGNDSGKYCDLMTYEAGSYFADGVDHTRVAYFSSPSISYQGQPTGHATLGDNARTLKEAKHYVSQYRDATTLLYCAAEGSDANYTNYNISNVQIGTIDQASSYSIYSDFAFNSTDVTVGESTNLTVTLSNGMSQNRILVWVDWNDDKDFEDAGEEVYVSSVGNVTEYVTGITPPQGTSAGEKRMRIRHVLDGYGAITPCGNGQYGEVEDYSLNVLEAATYNVTFNVTDGTNPIVSASVTYNGASQNTNASGQTVFTDVEDGTTAYSITKIGYDNANGNVTVSGSDVNKNVTMDETVYNVTFNVTDGTNPIETAAVTYNGTTQNTNASGVTVFASVSNGTTAYSIVKSGYDNANGDVTVSGSDVNKNVTMDETVYNVTFNVTDGTNPIETAAVTYNGTTQNTNASGATVFANVPNGTTAYSIVKTGYENANGNVTVSGSDAVKNITLVESDNTTASNITITNITANTATVNWDGEGAENYIIYYCQVGASNWATVTSLSSPYIIQNLEPNTEYNCKMRTTNEGVTSAYSALATFTTAAGTSTVASNITITGTTANTATVNWDGEGAERYVLYYNKEGTSNWGYYNTTSSPYTIQNLEPNTQYNCRLRTVNGGVITSYSAITSFTTDAGTSTVASNLVITGTTASSATLSWDGTGADRYIIYYNKVGTSGWGYYIATSSPYVIPNLEPNTQYYCRMRTGNGGVATPYTPITNFTTDSAPILASSNSDNSEDMSSESITERNSGFELPAISSEDKFHLNLYPNPTRSSLNITYNSNADESIDVRVIDITGKTLYNYPILSVMGRNTQLIEFSNLEEGIYFLNITSQSKSETKKFRIIK